MQYPLMIFINFLITANRKSTLKLQDLCMYFNFILIEHQEGILWDSMYNPHPLYFSVFGHWYLYSRSHFYCHGNIHFNKTTNKPKVLQYIWEREREKESKSTCLLSLCFMLWPKILTHEEIMVNTTHTYYFINESNTNSNYKHAFYQSINPLERSHRKKMVLCTLMLSNTSTMLTQTS